MASFGHGDGRRFDVIKRKALSPVISTLILSAAVITIGGSIWSYSISASTLIAEGYVNDTLELVNEVTERFVVEHVRYDYDTDTLFITVYNYGNQKIIVDAYVNMTRATEMNDYSGTVIQKGRSKEIPVPITDPDPVASGDKASIKIHSRRQNNAYKMFYIP
jgi:hypothetical protein